MWPFPHQQPHTRFRLPRLLLAVLAVGAASAGALSAGSAPPVARAASLGQLRQQVAAGRQRASELSGAVASSSQRLGQLNAGVAETTHRLNALQADLNAKKAELFRLRAELSAAQALLKRLEATEAADEQVLAQQLVGSYESGSPDIVTVVLSASGFNDLLERLDFQQRVQHQNTSVTTRVRAARRAVAAQALHLSALSQRQQQLTEQVLNARNSVAETRLSLLSQRLAVARTRADEVGRLSTIRLQLASLSAELSRLEAAQRAAAARAAAQAAARRRAAAVAQNSSGAAAPAAGSGGRGGSARSSGGFTFPMPAGAVSPPGTWSLDNGVDISAPGGTPEYAVCSGTVVLHGIGGFGPSAPVLHCDSPLDGYSAVYYGHAGPGNWVAIGTHVAQGQVISDVGYGDVGMSSGPHLEIGFADPSGAPVGPGSAPAMMALLSSSF